jgi:ubiquinone/menaquinone biosynthesis C-methylase UbiE
VLRPAQALKPFGLFRSREIGDRPERAKGRGAGQYYCRRHKKPVLLAGRPESYDTVVDFDRLSEDYDRIVAPFSRPIFEEVTKVLTSLATPRSRILDCSCGPGTELVQLAELVPQGEVVGSVTAAAANAKNRYVDNVAFFQADVVKMPKHFGAKFDFVYCGLAFHHYPDPLNSLREMRRVLKKGGHAMVIDAGPSWMKTIASPMAKWGDPGWVAFRTGEEFQELFLEAGFSKFYWNEILPGIGLSIGTC